MITFTRAQEVEPGGVIRSTEYNKLARACNDRLLSGVGDGANRIVWETMALCSQIRNRGESELPLGVFPFADEWLRVLALVKPESAITWPLTGPGDAEGINLNNPLGWFVYGVDPLKDEAGRLEPLVPYQGGSLADAWAAAKQQRGGFDPVTGFGVAPAIEIGVAHYSISYPYVVSFLKTFGGFQPAREAVGSCQDDAEQPLTKIIFTPVAPNSANLPVREFYGFCPAGSPGAATANHIAWIGYGRDSYHIYKWDENGDPYVAEYLLTKDYIEGPYTAGGRLAKGRGEQLEHALNYFIKDFRGADSERPLYPAKFDIRKIAFDFQTFWRTQYYLAPVFGEKSGDDIVLRYPQFGFDASAAAGTVASDPQSSVDIHHGFVLAGWYIQAVELQNTVEVELFDNAGWSSVASLTPNQDGYAEFLLYFEGPEVKRRDGVQVRVKTALELGAGGQLVVEIAELLHYKPTIDDAYVMLRLSSTRGGDATGQSGSLDTLGRNEAGTAIQMWEDYRRYGCIVNYRATGLPIQYDELSSAFIGYNPVYEAARLFNIQNVRLATRENLKDYEVINDNGVEKSVLYYKRDYLFQNSRDLDVFENIGPPRDPVESGKVMPFMVYEVQGDPGSSVDYFNHAGETVNYTPGQTFTGINGFPNYTSHAGAYPYQKDGIIATATPRSESNRWCCFFSCNVYRPTGILWRPDVYDTMIKLNQRCHFYSAHLGHIDNADLRQHYAPEQAPIINSEAPSGHIYTRGTHVPGRFDPPGSFFKSCQIYQAPYEVESCTNVTLDGVECVRIQLNQRLHHWDGTDPEYRTDENAVTDYLSGDCPLRIGDYGPQLSGGQPDFDSSDIPQGSCYCRLYFVRLVPEVWEDIPPNDVAQPLTDTRVLVDAFLQMEKYGRAMCEGFIDSTSSVALQKCELSVRESFLMDYTQENWYFDAFGGKFIPALPVAIAGEQIKAYGPFPRQVMYAEVFNCFVKAFNLLTRARIELPFSFEWKTASYQGRVAAAPDWPTPNDGCSPNTEKAVFFGLSSPPANVFISEDAEWMPAPVNIAASKATFIASDCYDEAGTFALQTNEVRIRYRFVLTDPLAYHAIPVRLRDLIDAGSVGFLGRLDTTTGISKAEQVETAEESRECGTVSQPFPGWFFHDGIGYKETVETTHDPGTCQIFTSGQVIAGDVPSSDYFVGRTAPMIGTGETCGNVPAVNVILNFAGVNQAAFVIVPLV